LTSSIGAGLFTTYLLLRNHFNSSVDGDSGCDHAGAAWRLLPAKAGVVPGDQVFSKELLDRNDTGDLSAVKTHSTEDAARLLGVNSTARQND